MSNPVWKGRIVYGGVSFAAKLFSAARAEGVHLSRLRKIDNSRVKEVLVAEADGQLLSRDEIAKGYEFEKGRYLVLTEADLVAANPPTPKVFNVEAFVDSEKLDALYLESSYYMAPEGEDDEVTYTALLGALRKSDVTGLGRISISTRERLAAISAGRSGILIKTLYYHAELGRINEFRANMTWVKEPARLEAQRAVRALHKDFAIETAEDLQTKRLRALIEQRLARGHKPAA